MVELVLGMIKPNWYGKTLFMNYMVKHNSHFALGIVKDFWWLEKMKHFIR
jgi:hypothetical protein